MADDLKEIVGQLRYHAAEVQRLAALLLGDGSNPVGAQSAPPHDNGVIDPNDLLLIEEAARMRRCVPRTIERLAKRVPGLLIHVHGKPFIRRSVLLQRR